jgi:hypothetical protein
MAVVAVSKVLLEEYVLNRVSIARLVLGGKVPQRVPIFALMKLTITRGIFAKGVQWCAISVAYCGLEIKNQHLLAWSRNRFAPSKRTPRNEEDQSSIREVGSYRT